jgi:hypothetical protein
MYSPPHGLAWNRLRHRRSQTPLEYHSAMCMHHPVRGSWSFENSRGDSQVGPGHSRLGNGRARRGVRRRLSERLCQDE